MSAVFCLRARLDDEALMWHGFVVALCSTATELTERLRSRRPWKLLPNYKSKHTCSLAHIDLVSASNRIESCVSYNRQGKIHHIGLSEVSARTLRRANAIAHVAAVQLEYSPFAMECEMDGDERFGVRQVCRELGVAVIAYSPLGECANFEKGCVRKGG